MRPALSPAVFFDTNVLVYIASADPLRSARAGALLREGGVVSVQVLNELVSVLRRKFRFDRDEANARDRDEAGAR